MFLGLDFGTSGARACVINHDKHIIWEQRQAYPDPAGQNPADWRTALYSLLRQLPNHFAGQLRGIAIDGTSGTMLLCNHALEPCSPALLYDDNRAQSQAEQLRLIAPEQHIVCSPTSGLAKFLWLTQQAFDSETTHCLHQADWLSALLSGKGGYSDYHNALKTGYDAANLCWPDWLLALPHSRFLPEVLPPGTAIGSIQTDCATRFSINPECVIYAGTTDSIAAFIATGTNQTDVGVTSLGTTLVLKQLTTQRIDAPEYGIYSHRYGDLWLVGGASNAGAGILRHYFDDVRLASLSAQIDPLQDSPLDYYPLSKAGERFPINDPQLAPRLTPRPASDVEFLQGLLQGLAHIEAAGYAKLAELGAPPLRKVISSGGGAKNPTWRTIRERILSVPVSISEHPEAAYGSALLCWKAQEDMA